MPKAETANSSGWGNAREDGLKVRIVGWLRAHRWWGTAYRTLSYLRSTLWVVPIAAFVLERVAYRLVGFVDPWITVDLVGLGVAGATSLFQTVVTLTLSFVIFTFGSLLVAIQVASGQMTPRIIATTLLRNSVIKYAVGLNVFSLAFAMSALNRTGETVPQLTTLTTALLGVGCLASFLFLIDYTARLLRPVRIVSLVCDEGVEVVRQVYPEGVGAPSRRAVGEGAMPTGAPARVLCHSGRSQVVLAVDVESLLVHATRAGGVIEFAPQVGDFVATGDPLFNLYGDAGGLDDSTLERSVAFGTERTMEQDPTFAFRILVDIALKALSPAINDPTTAVLAIDQIHRLLRFVGLRRLRDSVMLDGRGAVRLVVRTPGWDDFVNIACSEIRACGANNLQIARRMRAMLENLVKTLPESRRAALLLQLDLLDRTLPGHYKLPEDLALARVADPQGLGGTARGASQP